MPKLDLESIEQTNRTGYPEPFDRPVAGRWYRRLAPAGGLTQFGVSQVTLKPGAWSSQRHWHDAEDEFLVMISGEAILRAGDCAAFPAGIENGHHLRNDSDSECVFVVVGSNAGGEGGYSDIDMRFTADGKYVHKDGTPC